MAVICREHDLLFLPNSRTGSKAVRTALLGSGLGEPMPRPDQIVTEELKPHHTTLPSLLESGLVTASQLSRLLVFTGIRSPFDTVTSRYQRFVNWARTGWVPDWMSPVALALLDDMRERDVGFDEWVARIFELAWPSRNLYWTRWAHDYYRYENLEADFERILRRAGVESVPPLPRVNRTRDKKQYREYYSRRSRAAVTSFYAEDLEKFGYTF